MKRNISDLLDGYCDESVDLGSSTPLSTSRIKALTLRKIAQKNSNKRRFPIRLLVIAAMIAVLSISALAVDYVIGAGILMQDFFSNGDDLTRGQLAVMDQIGKTFEGGVTSDGATITPIAALADEHVYYLRLRIEAPEGVSLPNLDGDMDGYYQLQGDRPGENITLVPEEGAYKNFNCNLQLNWLPDSDPTDNMKEVVLQYSAVQGEGAGTSSDVKFNDGISKLLTIRGLWIQSPDKEYTQILSGEFTFDIGMYYESKIISLDCAGATYHDEAYGYTNVLDSLEISPLSLSYRFRSTLPDNDLLIPGCGSTRIVLKDGTVFFDNTYIEEPDPRYDAAIVSDTFVSSHEAYSAFTAPLDLSQVDYIQYGDYKFFLS